MTLDLEAIQGRYLAVVEQTGDWREWAARLGRSQQDVPALVMAVESMRDAIAWMLTEMPESWADTAAAEGRADVVRTVTMAMAGRE